MYLCCYIIMLDKITLFYPECYQRKEDDWPPVIVKGKIKANCSSNIYTVHKDECD